MGKADATLRSLGEKRLIREVIDCLEVRARPILPLNDDAQVVSVREGSLLVISTDRTPSDLSALKLGLMSLRELGNYSVVSNLSDLAAMGADPVGILLSVAANREMLVDDFRELLEGVVGALNEYEVALLGGDTKEANELNLVCTAVGEVGAKDVLKRSGAKPGHKVFTSRAGAFGLVPAALKYFLIAKPRGLKLGERYEETLIESLVDIRARFEEARLLRETGLCTSCIDNTDGIFASLRELSNASEVGFNVVSGCIRIPPCVQEVAKYVEMDPLNLALAGGADFRLIGSVKKFDDGLNEHFVCIGEVIDEKEIQIDGIARDDIPIYEHFS